jgi:hypothetical protein
MTSRSSRNQVVAYALVAVGLVSIGGADAPPSNPSATFKQYCYQCHGNGKAMGGVSLEQLTSQASPGEGFQSWQKVATALDQNHMPPKGLPQPSETARHNASAWIRNELDSYIKKHDGDPGRVTVRRLTSGEYAYTMHDLTGLDIDLGIDATSDSVGGEGFTNFGDVQFMQDANLERYLQAAKKVAAHAVIGSGPIEFYSDPGKTGFELSAISRIKQIYGTYGFRTVSGEGGFPYGLEKYSKAFLTAWRFQHRKALGEPNVKLETLAMREGIVPRFAQHIWTVMNTPKLGYPSSEVAARWRKLPVPAGPDAKASIEQARAGCLELQKYVTTWPSWLFARGDAALGGAGDESPLILNESALKTETKHHFNFFPGARLGTAARTPAPTGPVKVYLNVTAVNPNAKDKPIVIWRNVKVAVLPASQRRTPQAGAKAGGDAAAAVQPTTRRGLPANLKSEPLRSVLTAENAAKLHFGKSPDGTELGPDDFASEGSTSFEIPKPDGANLVLQLDAELGRDHDQVFRIILSDRADGGSRGIPTRALIADPNSPGFRSFKAGFLELIALMPPNSQSEPTPADKDPIPLPFDSTYNVPEHDAFDNDVKYIRDDSFIYKNMLDDTMRARVDYAWKDLYSSFAYHTNYMRLLGEHFKLDLKKTTIAELDDAKLAAMPADARKYMTPLIAGYKSTIAAEEAARPRHIEDCLKFAGRAWRRPLTEKEKLSLRAFYAKSLAADPDPRTSIRALIARILVAPQFLYRVEQASVVATAAKPLTGFELASRMSYFLWSSIPDDELSRAAAAGELSDPQQIRRQAKRMLADPKARRLSTEFFGQWLGFYHFDEFKGVDTGRFPEFTNEVKESMYDEAVSFFEHIVRKDRPVREIVFADYAFLNRPLAKFYGVKTEVKSKDQVELVEGANSFQRGGMLRLGAVLTVTSAPLRTSPVKRGDWILRRVLGTPVPPPPANAGSLPADDKMFGGLTLKQKLNAHKRNASCANCHVRIDPLGFSLEHFDSTGRWRETYADGKAIEDSDELSDHTPIAGVTGLLNYLKVKEDQVRRTLSYKLLGYALGRTVIASDQPLVDRLVGEGGNAGFSTLIADIVTSKQFRNHLAGADPTPNIAVNLGARK